MQTPSSRILFLSRRGQISVSENHGPHGENFPKFVFPPPKKTRNSTNNRGNVCSWWVLCNSQFCERRRLFIVLGVLMRQGLIISSWVVPPPSNSHHQDYCITFLVGDPYKPSFATVTGRGDNPNLITSC